MRPVSPLFLTVALLAVAACERTPPPAPAAPPPPVAPTPVTPAKPAPPPAPVKPTPIRAAEPPVKTAGAGLLPLARILAIARARTPGEVIDVDFDDGDDDDPPSYEVKILTPEGRSIETRIDARGGRILELEED
ncbi:MAG: PepSY domain-containing protein [Caulobacter sp.]|nr:PepSY domain-containing protein [Caulobacter sp.]